MMKTEQKNGLQLQRDTAGRGFFVTREPNQSSYKVAYEWSSAHNVPRVMVWLNGDQSLVDWDCCTAEGQRDLMKQMLQYTDSFRDELKETLFDIGVDKWDISGSGYSGGMRGLTETQALHMGEVITGMVHSLIDWVVDQQVAEAPV